MNYMIKKLFLPLIIFLISSFSVHDESLKDSLKEIDDEFYGNIGVFIKDLGDGSVLNYNTDRMWYLASTTKIPLAIAVLQKVEDGEFSLTDELKVKEHHLIDGSGDLLWHEPGSKFTILELIERMLKDSDSTATDMLIELLGEEAFNEHIKARIVDEGLGYITSIQQVRYDAYGELHEKAAALTNMDFITLKGVTPISDRLNELLRIIEVEKSDIKVKTIPNAFELYYARHLNSGNLQSMGLILENLANGEYLNEAHTEILIDIMKGVNTGDRRIKAGLPAGVEWAHKTNTQ